MLGDLAHEFRLNRSYASGTQITQSISSHYYYNTLLYKGDTVCPLKEIFHCESLRENRLHGQEMDFSQPAFGVPSLR